MTHRTPPLVALALVAALAAAVGAAGPAPAPTVPTPAASPTPPPYGRLDWTDRRPVGMFFLHMGTATAQNPLGYRPEPAPSPHPAVDVTTPAGIADFQNRMNAFADACTAELKRVNAQGFVWWDVGWQPPADGVNYTGEPRALAKLREWDLPGEAAGTCGFARQWCQRFVAAGLRPGVCVRHTTVVRNDVTGQRFHAQPAGIVNELDAKVQWAHDTLGCSLFYVDSFVSYNPADAKGLIPANFTTGPWLKAKGLAVFEQAAPGTELWGAPYNDPVAAGRVGSDRTRFNEYAFSVVRLDRIPPSRDGEAVAAVRAGDALFCSAWTYPALNDRVIAVYQQAGK